MNQRYTSFFKWVNVAVDYALLNLVLYVSIFLAATDFSWQLLPVQDHYKLHFLIVNLFWFYCSHQVGLYQEVLKREAEPTVKATLLAYGLCIGGIFVMKASLPQYSLPPDFLFYSASLFGVALMAWKVSFLLLRKSRRDLWVDFKKVVIVGAGPVGLDLHAHLTAHPQLGHKVEGFFDDHPRGQVHPPLLGKINDCMPYVKANGVAEIYCALPTQELGRAKALMQEADNHLIRFRLVPDIKDLFDQNMLVELYGHMPVLTPRQEPLDNKANELLKRAFDIVFSLLVITMVLSWLTPLLAVLIRLESKGPVLFKQLRSGRHNKPFYCLKFRSMTVNEDSDSRQASRGDVRVTRVGAFIRKTSIDELPQFFNVLIGDMSVVGPRPHMLKHTEDYSQLIDKYMVRHFLMPGISGWAQVNGHRGETRDTESMERRVKADLWYLENWSLLLDLKIVFLTVWQALRGHNNAF